MRGAHVEIVARGDDHIVAGRGQRHFDIGVHFAAAVVIFGEHFFGCRIEKPQVGVKIAIAFHVNLNAITFGPGELPHLEIVLGGNRAGYHVAVSDRSTLCKRTRQHRHQRCDHHQRDTECYQTRKPTRSHAFSSQITLQGLSKQFLFYVIID